jgi:hypothetical protein
VQISGNMMLSADEEPLIPSLTHQVLIAHHPGYCPLMADKIDDPHQVFLN